MQLCSLGHEEVHFESEVCPACAIRDQANELIADLQDKIDALEKEIESL